ncbi:uncharacterized protein LOC100159639 [Acyrthosiphon pisum]|uniref:INO80 complex subunit B-like conserved region domain-containing protein n=1 Tax=Acyrthosiphon pisum TaxID=7029 RepID=A0A8R2NT87_ACYPI|nr:uncharacterized protein LOC100159639 [Acyrthosiphon pisum]
MSGNDEYVDVMTSSPPLTTRTTLQSSGMKKKKVKNNKDNPGSSDEERWLKAIETGKLDEVDDELKKIKKKDPKMMTARQRAMFDRKSDKEFTEELVALPSGYREKVLTPEMLQKKAIKSQKRKQQADEKRENDKKRTMERLLKKHESKSKTNAKGRMARKAVNNIIYISKMIKYLYFPESILKKSKNQNLNKLVNLKVKKEVRNATEHAW